MQQKAGFFKRIKLAIKQPKDSIVFRTADGVWHHTIDNNMLEFKQNQRFNYLQEYAEFSARAYHDDGSVNQHPVANSWRRILSASDVDNLSLKKRTVSGLKYDAWYCDQSRQLVIAFRGSGKRLGDWFSNFRWVTRIIPGVQDHYDVVHDNIHSILERALSSCGQVDNIVTTGHSLGGGLAQHAAYSSPKIDAAYAFNPTPVTGYRSIEQSKRQLNSEDLFIARVFEHGEVLAYLRFGLRSFYKISSSSPQIVELRFNFSRQAGVIREHGMGQFASHVWAIFEQPQNQSA